jgi:2-methylisocitrate lyase-like PEP mutase family enzyme
MTQRPDLARAFQALHERGFLMPNAWDAGAAKLLAAEGFPAVGVTSAGVAFSLGKPDYGVGEPRFAVTRDEMLRRSAEIAAAVEIPVNADLEAGYGRAPETVAETVRLAAEAGLAGGNIEDRDPAREALYDEALAVERIAAARAAAPDFVLNARTDAMLLAGPRGFAEAVRRANRYLAAGADCVFTPGPVDAVNVARLASEIEGPINVVIGLGDAEGDANALIVAGARRVSVGGSIARSALAFVRDCARELKDKGTVTFAKGQMPQRALNALFAATPAAAIRVAS